MKFVTCFLREIPQEVCFEFFEIPPGKKYPKNSLFINYWRIVVKLGMYVTWHLPKKTFEIPPVSYSRGETPPEIP